MMFVAPAPPAPLDAVVVSTPVNVDGWVPKFEVPKFTRVVASLASPGIAQPDCSTHLRVQLAGGRARCGRRGGNEAKRNCRNGGEELLGLVHGRVRLRFQFAVRWTDSQCDTL